MSGAADTLVAHAISRDWAALPETARAAAKTFLHDTLCVGVAGRNGVGADRIFAAARGWSGAPERGCAVLGRPGARMTAPYAAFVNAFQIHCQEFDCVHEPAVAHPMATVVSALLADAERGPPCSGSDFLAALVAGVDVVATLGVAVTTPLRFFRPATAGIFGSVAALCRLRRLSHDDSSCALGNALAFASGTMQAHLEGKPTLAVQVAGAARSAVEAVDLALAGMAAPAASIDGPFGYMTLFEGGHHLGDTLHALGRAQRVSELSWKPFPTGRAGHGGIVAIQALRRDHGVTAEQLAALEYRAPPLIARLVGRAAFVGMGTAHARLCLPYLGALTLLRGSVGLDDFTPERLADPAVHALAGRISVSVDGNTDPAAFGPAEAIATLHDGRRIGVAVDRQYGSPCWPLTNDEHLRKAEACLAFGGLAEAHAPLRTAMQTLESAADVVAALRPAFGETPAA
jgi:2-methylcitrate dehydratase PrpD